VFIPFGRSGNFWVFRQPMLANCSASLFLWARVPPVPFPSQNKNQPPIQPQHVLPFSRFFNPPLCHPRFRQFTISSPNDKNFQQEFFFPRTDEGFSRLLCPPPLQIGGRFSPFAERQISGRITDLMFSESCPEFRFSLLHRPTAVTRFFAGACTHPVLFLLTLPCPWPCLEV